MEVILRYVRSRLKFGRFILPSLVSLAIYFGASLGAFAFNYNLSMFWRNNSAIAFTPTGFFLSGGGFHSCALLANGAARCWGLNASGQIGNGTTVNTYVPTAVSGLSGATSISAGYHHNCAVLADHTVKCWGNGALGTLGDGSGLNSSVPVTVSGINDAISVSSGDNSHSCALSSSGTVRCWGQNTNGQLGNGTTTASMTPVVVSGITNAIAAAAGGNQCCAILSGGTGRCWGNNSYGELGNASNTRSSTPVTVSGLNGAVNIMGGGNHNCALIYNGTVRCWGRNTEGQLGNGSTTNSNIPVTVSGINSATAIATGYYFTCAVLVDGSAKCWGKNDYSQLGIGTTTNSSTPVTASGISNAISITTGDYHACALLADGSARCWGGNLNAQLGTGKAITPFIPTLANSLSNNVSKIETGLNFSCALLSDGTVKCWGQNNYGQAGNGVATNSTTPVTVSGISNAVSIAIGDSTGCAILSDSTAQCWGRNYANQLGNGSAASYIATPVTVSGLSGVVSISPANGHTCALLSDGTVKCWGSNSQGQLGNNSNVNSAVPVTVSGLSGAVSITTGNASSCAVLSDGTVRCWGSHGGGQLGHGAGAGIYTMTTVQVSGITNAVAASLGANHACALLSDGTMKCWGHNAYGQVGDGSTTNTTVPVVVSGLSNVVSIKMGTMDSCVVLTDGTSKCWGNGADGRLGNGSTTSSLSPAAVSGINGVVSVSPGPGNHVCALLSNGYTWCWGNNTYGQLGVSWPTYETNISQVYGFDRDTASTLTGISGTSPVTSDGSAQSTISIQLTQPSGSAWSGVTPTFTATDTLGRNVMGACSPSNGSGQSTCSLKSTYAEVKDLWLTSPIRALAYPTSGVTFAASTPAKLVVKGLSSLKQSECSSRPFQIQLTDANENPVAATGNFTVTVSGLGSAQIYTDPLCTQVLSTSLGFVTGASAWNFYLKDATAETISLQGAATGLTTGTLSITIAP